MRRFNGLAKGDGRLVWVRAVGVSVFIVATFAMGNAVVAFARSPATKLCVPRAAGKPVKTPTRKGHCPRKYKLVDLGREGRPGPVGPLGPLGPKGERGEKGDAGQVEALQFLVTGGGLFTGGQVVSVPLG